MKTQASIKNLLALTGSAIFAVSSASATTYYWDSNSTTAGFGSTAGTWGTSLFWGTDAAGTGATAATVITGTDTVNFGTATLNYNNGAIGVAAGGVATGGIVIGAGQTTAFNLGTAGNAITIGSSGITKDAGSATVTTISPVILDGAQAWTNNSTNSLTLNSTLNLNGNKLTTGGSGTTNFAGAAGAVVSGSGGIDVTGGRLWLGSAATPVHTYSGDTTITGGAVVMIAGNASANSNININGGVLESYWSQGLNRTIGTGANQIRITGGESGFALNGSNGATFTLGALTWGDTNFNPSKLLLQTQYSQGVSSVVLASAINLNGANRTVVASSGLVGTATSTISGNITNSTGTAGFIKEGAGLLNLTGTNTYNGGTTISAGTLAFGSIAAMPNSGLVAVNNATLGVEVGGGGDWTTGTSGVGTLGGLLAGVGGAGTSTVSYTGNVGLRLTMTGNVTYSGDIANVGTTLALNKAGANSLTLSGNNSYTGGTTVTAGLLILNSTGALGAAGQSVTLNGGTLDLHTDTSVNAYNVTVAAASTIEVDRATSGAGIVNTLGTLNMGAFTLSVTANSAHNVLNNTNYGLTFGNTTLSGNATFSVANLGTGIGTLTLGAIGETGGSRTLTKTGAGDLTLSSANSYTGATAAQVGNLIAGTNSLVSTNGAFGNAASEISFGVAGGNSAAGIFTGGAYTIGRSIRLLTSNTTDAGTRVLTLGGNTAHDSVYSGNIILGSNNQAGRGVTLTAAENGKVTFSGVIQNPTGMDATTYTVTKSGLGTVVLSNTNTYTGATAVSQGRLLINGSTSVSSIVTVAAGATLGGSGTVGGNTTISGIHSPGNSPGIQTFGGNLAYTGGASVVNWELTGNTTTNAPNPGAIFDQVIVGGNLDFTNATALNLIFNVGSTVLWSDSLWDTDQSWTLYDVAGTTTNFGNLSLNTINWLDSGGFAFNTALTGSAFSISQFGQDVVLNYTIPEPSAALLGCLGVLIIFRRRR